jgi:F-type H+-transporting ATPase subunit epsilon
MGELKVEVVAVDRMVWSGTATSLVAKTLEGEIGILPGHEPVLALLADSAVRIECADGERLVFAVHKGFFSVADNRVSVLAESAELAAEIDVHRAGAALERAKAEAGSGGGAGDSNLSDDPSAAVARAETRLKVAGHNS